uniref:Leucine-rich repeat-containing N-terminal plant-type domain-containing protein n=1 Tax=Fagus sylvatica TaxID=28930 RepID=A0A2N9GTC4_FAGSY
MDASLRPVTFLFLVFLIIIHPNFFCNGDSQSQIRCIQTVSEMPFSTSSNTFKILQTGSPLGTGDGDCCQWMGVVCHNVTGHVHQLHLRSFPPISADEFTTEAQYEAQSQAYERSMFGGKLNPSLLDLKYLNYLDLSYNNFSGTQIPKFLGSMESLRYLNLSNAGFGGVIPHQLGNLSNLQYLNLEGDGYLHLYVNNLQWLSGLPLLQHLDMSSVNLSEASDWLQVTNKLPSLLELRLSGCGLRFIPPTPSVNFSSLTTLDLSGNRFENTLILSWIVGLRNLVFLDLSVSSFQGPIPVVLQNMTSLRHLDLSGNNFNHSIPNWLYSFSRLEFLNLGSNNLQGTIPVLQNMTSLRHLDLSYNYFNHSIPNWLYSFSRLEFLNLRSNNLQGPIPVLQNMTSLRHLDLSGNYFNHSIPNWLYSFSRLEFLNLVHNHLQGSNFPPWLCSQRHLQYLDISNTGVSDMVPPSFWKLNSQLRFLNLSHNLIHGEIENSLTDFVNSSVIDLSSNHFKGTMGSLESIDFSVNQLSALSYRAFDASNFIGNKLCGPPLTDNCTVNGVKPNNEDIGRIEVDWFYVSMALGFVVGFWGVCGPLLLNKQWRIMYFQFLDHMGYKLKGVLSFQYCECKGLISSQWRKLKLAASKVCGSDSYSRQVRWRLASSRHIEDSAGNKGWNIPMTVFDSEVLTVGLVYLPFAFDDICPVIYSI